MFTENDYKVFAEKLQEYNISYDEFDETNYEKQAERFLTSDNGIMYYVPDFESYYNRNKEQAFILAARVFYGRIGEEEMEVVVTKAKDSFITSVTELEAATEENNKRRTAIKNKANSLHIELSEEDTTIIEKNLQSSYDEMKLFYAISEYVGVE